MTRVLSGTIDLQDWYNNREALVKPGSLLYILKNNIINALQENGIVDNTDLNDEQNKIPYIKFKKKFNPYDHNIYNSINNKKFMITSKDFYLKRNNIFMKFSLKKVNQIKMLIVYKKDILSDKIKVSQIVDNVLNQF